MALAMDARPPHPTTTPASAPPRPDRENLSKMSTVAAIHFHSSRTDAAAASWRATAGQPTHSRRCG
jgi:hypothetical protein